MCGSVSPIDGGLEVRYEFIHTGGLDLLNTAISYMVLGSNEITSVPELDMTDSMATIVTLVAGYRYRVLVTGTNANGSTVAECPETMVNAGNDLM